MGNIPATFLPYFVEIRAGLCYTRMQNGILSQFQAQRLSRLHKAHFPGLYTFDTTPKRNAMKKVISVRFKDNGKTYYFDPADTPIKTGDYVIVETARGVECGEVVQGVKEIADSAVPKALKPITRMADRVDVRRMRQNREDESAPTTPVRSASPATGWK